MTQVGYLAAFLGGVLALLSPCSALLLPSFFAYAFVSRGRLLANTSIFYLGLAAALVPLGAGSAALSGLVIGHRQTLVLVGGWAIVALGVLQLLGGGFTVGPAAGLRQRFASRGGWIAVLGLGASYGLAGFCSGPILGAVLTIAAIGGQVARGMALLAVYALGMAAPLYCLAALWRRLDLDRRHWLRGRAVTLGPLRLHTTTALSGLLFIGIGAMLLIYRGTSTLGMLGLAPSAASQVAAQQAVRAAGSRIPDTVVLVVVGAVVLAVGAWRLRRPHRPHPDPSTESAPGKRPP